MNKFTQYKIITITAILIALACFFAIYLRLFTEKELWYEMFAAVLGVVITAIITMILLRGQSAMTLNVREPPRSLKRNSEYTKTIFIHCMT